MSTKTTTDQASQGSIQYRTLNPIPRTLYGQGFSYRLPRNKAVTAGDIANKQFDNSKRRTYYTQPEWFPAEAGSNAIASFSGNPDINSANPVFQHENVVYEV